MASSFQELWQRNRSLGIYLLGGGALFLIGETAIGFLYREDLESSQARIAALRREIQKPVASAENLAWLEAAHSKLQGGIEKTQALAEFRGTPAFAVAQGGASPENQYFDIVTRVRSTLLRRAHHQNIEIPDSLGLPAVSPTGEEEISRVLRGLELVVRACEAGISAEIDRVEELRIEPSRKQRNRETKASKGAEPNWEEIRIQMKVLGTGLALSRFVESASSGKNPLVMERAKITQLTKGNQVRGEFEFLALRLLGDSQEKGEERK